MACALIAMTAGCTNLLVFSNASTDGGSDNAPVVDDEPDDGGNGGGTASKLYYVSPLGSDGADGLTLNTALRTIAHAVEVAQPGDVVAILAGTYTEAVRMEGVGAADAPITLRGEGGTPGLDGTRQLSVGVRCERCTNIVIADVEFQGYTDVGVLATQSSKITLRNLVVHDNGFAATLEYVEGYGIHVEDSQEVIIEGCEAFRNGPNPQVPDRWLGTGIDTYGLTDAVIRNNRSHDNTGGGLLVEDSSNVLVEGNEITGNNLDASIEEWWDGGIWVDGGHDVTLRNNTIRDNLGPGVEISDEDNQAPYGYLLEGNTITGNYFGLYVWNFGTPELPPSEVLELSNNDVSGNTRQDIWIEAKPCPVDDPC
ncbi:MAG: nitrous oxide reductase family maturation protein NosD, partial [Phycisphaerae bacterium]